MALAIFCSGSNHRSSNAEHSPSVFDAVVVRVVDTVVVLEFVFIAVVVEVHATTEAEDRVVGGGGVVVGASDGARPTTVVVVVKKVDVVVTT